MSDDGPSGAYRTRIEHHHIGGVDWRIRSLADTQQHHDPDGLAAAAGISDAQWPHFGQVWPAGLALARNLADVDLGARRVLEIGCGLAIAGMVVHRGRAEVTVSDHHPLARSFLDANLALNALGPLPYRHVDWTDAPASLGRFDLVIGSDILYERDHADQIARFVDAHAHAGAEILVADPGRRQAGRFRQRMTDLGFARTDEPCAVQRMRVMRFVTA